MVLQIFFVLLIPSSLTGYIKFFSLYSSVLLFLASLKIYERLGFMLLTFNSTNYKTFFFTGEVSSLSSSALNVYYTVGIDGISVYFLLLTTFLTPICILIS